MQILVVDDSKTMRNIVIRAVKLAGYDDVSFAEAANGAEALHRIRATPPAVALVDWNMPEMTGIEVLRQLRAAGNDVKFGFVTSECTPEMQQQAAGAGAAFFIVKPFTAERFDEVFSPILG